MEDKTQYYVVRKKAIPEVLLKVVEAKKMLDSGKVEIGRASCRERV